MTGKTEKTTRTRVNPASWEMPHIMSVLGGAQNLYQSGAPTYAQFSPTTEQALTGYENRAMAGSPIMDMGSQSLMDTMSGKYLTPESNPYLQQYGNALSQQIQDRVNAEFSKAGRYNSGAHAGTTAREIGNTLSGLYGNAYENERNRMFGATSQAIPFANQDYRDLQAMLGAGQERDIKAQQAVEDPYRRILQYLNIIRGVPQGRESYSKSTESSTPGVTDILGTLGGIASIPMGGGETLLGSLLGGGAAAGGGLAGALGAAGAGATAGLAGPGTIAALASDPALKEDIHPVDGEDALSKFRKLPVSDYRYKDGAQMQFGLPERRTGPMATDYAQTFRGDGHTIDIGDVLGNAIAAIKALDERTRNRGFGRRAA